MDSASALPAVSAVANAPSAASAVSITPPTVEFRTRRVKLTGAINETLSFRLAVCARDVPIKRPELRAAPFLSSGGAIGPSAVQVFRMHRVDAGAFPGWHVRSIPPARRAPTPLDVLVPIRAPRGGLPATLVPGETYYFWADVAIPKGTPDGEYNGRVELTSGNSVVAGVDVDLTVWPFILPDEPDVSVIAELDHRELLLHHVAQHGRPVAVSTDDWRGTPMEPQFTALLRSTVQLLQSHRLTPVLHTLSPTVKVGGNGEIAVDWDLYDALVEPWLSGQAFFNRVPLRYWPMPLQAMFSGAEHENTPLSPGYTHRLRQYLAECATHFKENGWLERSYAPLPVTKGISVESIRRTRELSELARGVEPHVALMSQLWPQDMAPYGWVGYPFEEFSEAVDVWVPPAQFYDLRAMADQRSAGRRTWVAIDRPPYSGSLAVQAPPAYARVLSWQTDQLGADVLLTGCINRWPKAEFHPTPDDCVQADPNVLLYPGGPFGMDEPVPSVRLKHLRDSLQDAAYRALLKKHGLEHVTVTLARSLAPYAGSDAYRTHFADGRPAGWVEDATLFDLAREIMAEELMHVSHEAGAKYSVTAPTEQLERSSSWRRFMSTARGLDVSVDGTRMRLGGGRAAWEAEVECALAIVNRTRMPVAGRVRFGQLPEGWTEASEGRIFESISPNSSRRVVLGAVAAALPSAPGASVYLPIEFGGQDGAVHRSEARASCVTAIPRNRGIRIDGDLSDWPPGAANVACDFRLITAQAVAGVDAAAARPSNATVAFVMRDREFLYLAVNCAGEGAAPQSRSSSNQVVYDDLIPIGDELVEVLIDPLNSGTRSPTDLFHIAVKPSGTYLAEKGMRFDPPCGKREPWPAEINLATRVSKDRWTAELRIPLRSFTHFAAEHTIWGFNITRYDAARQEFSTWSGATSNAYDPLSLGNLYIP